MMIENRLSFSRFLKKKSEVKKHPLACLIQNPILVHIHLRLDPESPMDELIRQTIEAIALTANVDQQVQNLVIAVDITSHPCLLSESNARQIAQAILSALDHRHPALRDRFVGISDNEQLLPLHSLMRTGALAWEEIDNQHLFVFE